MHTFRGVRQGCRIAPALWSLQSGHLLKQEAAAHSQTELQAPHTTFADDTASQWQFHSLECVLAMERRIVSLFALLTEFGLEVNPPKSSFMIQVVGDSACRLVAQRTVQHSGRPHWRLAGSHKDILIPLVAQQQYLGTILSFGRDSDKTVDFRLQEAHGKEAKLRRCIRSKGLLSAHKRVSVWRACVLTSATFGLHTTKVTSKSAHTLRSWFFKSVRAVTGLPPHITHVSNDALCARFGLMDPVAMLAGQVQAKLKVIQEAAHSIAADTPVLAYWVSLRPHCGLYFRSVKTLRQHEARKHGTLTVIHAEDFFADLHARNGMPQCRHCDRTFFNMAALKGHIQRNACQWRPWAETTSGDGLSLSAPAAALDCT